MADANELRIQVGGQDRTFPPGAVVRIGRDPDNDIVVDNQNVSRHHAQVEQSRDGWVLTDLGSAQGVFVEGRRVRSVEVGGRVELGLGQGAAAEPVVLEAAPTGRGRPGGTVGASTATVMPSPEARRPGGALREEGVQGQTVVTGHTINVECAGRSYTFGPGRDVRIGRDPASDVATTNPTVSRDHAVLRHDGQSWVLQDVGSGGGTYVDGKRVTTVPVQGSMAVWLGDVDTGERVVLVTSGARTAPAADRASRALRSGRAPLLIAGLAALAVVVAVVAIVAVTRRETPPNNDELARGTVRIELPDVGIGGSGSVIDREEGLILTNAHVVSPRALGLGVAYSLTEDELPPEPREIRVYVASGLGDVAEPRFLGEVVAVDGYVDLAVVRLTETVGGGLIEPEDLADLTEIELGNSAELGIGERIRVFGFPAVAGSDASTITEGVVSGSQADRRLATNDALLNVDANIAGGNSGGLAADERGRIVGVPSSANTRGSERIGAIRPIDFAKPLIEAARNDEPYEPGFDVHPLPEDASFANFQLAGARREGFELDCDGPEAGPLGGAGTLGVSFDFEGMVADQHQDMWIRVWRLEDDELVEIGETTANAQWPMRWPEEGCATATIPLVEQIDLGTYAVEVYAGPNNERVGGLEITVS